MTALGVRDNNPLNLIYVPRIKWNGLATPPNCGRFCSFRTPQLAFRAYTIELGDYIRAGHDTVPKFIKVWSETDQDPYIVNVLRWGHFGAMQTLTVADALALFKAMCRQEDGSDPYPDSVIQEGINMATDTAPTKPTTFASLGTMAVSGGGAAALGNDLANVVIGALHDFWHIVPAPESLTSIKNICVALAAFVAARYVHDKVFNNGASNG